MEADIRNRSHQRSQTSAVNSAAT